MSALSPDESAWNACTTLAGWFLRRNYHEQSSLCVSASPVSFVFNYEILPLAIVDVNVWHLPHTSRSSSSHAFNLLKGSFFSLI
jgi:hypothetical protein